MLGVETAPNIGGPSVFQNSDLFDADDDDSDEEVVRSTKPKQSRPTKALRLILSDDESEDSDDGLPSLEDISHDGKENLEETNGTHHKKPKVIPSDEESDEEDDDGKQDGVRDESGGEDGKSDSSDDDGSSEEGEGDEEEEEIAFQLSPIAPDLDQAENGDARPSRRRRVKKDELQQIHSETQRIVRESTIRIPYHRPKPLTLDELFSKKPSVTALKPIRGKVPRIQVSQHDPASSKQEKSPKNIVKDSTDELPDVLSSQITQENNDTCIDADGANLDTLSKDTTQEASTVSENGTKVDTKGVDECQKIPDGVEQMETDECTATSTETNPDLTHEDAPEGPTLSTPVSKETSPPPVEGEEPMPVSTQRSPPEEEMRDETSPTFKTPTPAPARQATPQSSQARRMKLLQESLGRLKGAKPRLSGGSHATIDLDEGAEPSPEQKGMANLMKRFVEHTKHIKPLQPKDVQVNIVTKEKGADGKEDLKHHTFTVGLEAKPEELVDQTLKVPGAKLVRLKETLQSGMKARREKERMKREEAFQLDNEEGFGAAGVDEDEAELTEGSETEEEDGGDADDPLGLGDEDDDADYVPGNEFVDDEADSDDDDVDEEEEEEYRDGEDEEDDDEVRVKASKKSKPPKIEKKKPGLDSDDDEISPSRRKSSKKRAMVVDDDDDDDADVADKGISLRLNSVDTDDTDSLQDSGRFRPIGLGLAPRSISALDQCSKTMEMFDSATNSTVTSDFQIPTKLDSSTKRVSWCAGKDTDSSKDSSVFVLPVPVRQDSSSNSMDTSFDMMASLIPAHQPEGGMRRSGRASADSTTKEGFRPFAKHQSILSGLSSKGASKLELNPLTMPVEDSQDLFRDESPRLPTIADSQQVGESQSFHFSFEDETQTQFLDENGLLNLKPSSRKAQSKTKPLYGDSEGQSAESQSSMDELLGLCSGKFTETQAPGKDESKPGPFSQVSQGNGTQANMDELLDLCSGTFREAKSQMTSTRKMSEKEVERDGDNDKDDDVGSNASFHIMSDPDGLDTDDEDDDKEKGFSSDDEGLREKKGGEDDGDDEEEEDDDDRRKVADDDGDADNSDLDSEFEFDVNRKAFKGKTYSKKMNIRNFVDAEAELSGSEADSDEDYDAEDEPDDEDLEGIVNEEMGDEEELRDQVNKVHMKTLADDDARRLRLYKEMYLPDGDLHSDNKRTRNFRWRNLDSQMDMFRPDSEGEENEDDAQQDQDTQWRLQRYQREQWLKENEGKDKPAEVTPEEIVPVEEDSQFAKCLRTASFRKPRGETPTQEIEEKNKEKDKKVSTPKPLKIMTKRGSFLSRDKNELAKMASMLKPMGNPQGPRNNRNFVFQSAEASMNENSNTASEPSKVKRSVSVSSTPSSAGPKAKRPRLDRSQSQFTSNSVFRHF